MTASDSGHHRPRVSSPSDTVIDPDRCMSLLASVRVARVAFVDDGRPQLVVMNHRTDGDDVLLRTDEDSRLVALTSAGRSVPVALEVDSVSAAGRSGWSVIAAGTLARDDSPSSEHLPQPWRSGATDVVLRMSVEEINGLQVSPGGERPEPKD